MQRDSVDDVMRGDAPDAGLEKLASETRAMRRSDHEGPLVTACGEERRGGLLFDLDGTLAQTEHLHHAAFNALLAAYGRSIDHPTFLKHVSGRSNEDITAYLFPGLDPLERERLADDKERWFRELAAAGVEATPGAMSLIDWARARGIATGLVTNAPRENAPPAR